MQPRMAYLPLAQRLIDMALTHNLGFPRIGAKRELKFSLESYWKAQSSRDDLKSTGAELRRRHWQDQAALDLVPVGDFAFYDQVLDMSFTLGNLPERVGGFHGDALDNYFRVARGRSAGSADEHAQCCGGVAPRAFSHAILARAAAGIRTSYTCSSLLRHSAILSGS